MAPRIKSEGDSVLLVGTVPLTSWGDNRTTNQKNADARIQ
jgi:hypothetical protein